MSDLDNYPAGRDSRFVEWLVHGKPLLRIWHFFRGHPVDECWGVIGDDLDSIMECEGCGKEGKRL